MPPVRVDRASRARVSPEQHAEPEIIATTHQLGDRSKPHVRPRPQKRHRLPRAVRRSGRHVVCGYLVTAEPDFKASSLPAGRKGKAGPKGDTGPAGLSASVVQDDLPASTASGTLSSAIAIKHVTIDLPSAGKLVVIDPVVESLSSNNPTSSTVTYSGVGLYSHTLTLALIGNTSDHLTASSTRLVVLAAG